MKTHMNYFNKMCAVVLAGGLGSRMGEVSRKRQKCLTPIYGRPILDYVLEDLLELGYRKIVLVTNHLKDQIEEYIGTLNSDRICTVSTVASGTAGALLAASKLIDSDPFLYLHGDMYFCPKLHFSLVEKWDPSRMYALTAVSPIWLASTHPYMTLSPEEQVLKIYYPGKGDEVPKDALCSLEAMLLSRQIINAVADVSPSHMLSEAIKISGQMFFGRVYNDEWFHLETLDDAENEQAHEIFLKRKYA